MRVRSHRAAQRGRAAGAKVHCDDDSIVRCRLGRRSRRVPLALTGRASSRLVATLAAALRSERVAGAAHRLAGRPGSRTAWRSSSTSPASARAFRGAFRLRPGAVADALAGARGLSTGKPLAAAAGRAPRARGLRCASSSSLAWIYPGQRASAGGVAVGAAALAARHRLVRPVRRRGAARGCCSSRAERQMRRAAAGRCGAGRGTAAAAPGAADLPLRRRRLRRPLGRDRPRRGVRQPAGAGSTRRCSRSSAGWSSPACSPAVALRLARAARRRGWLYAGAALLLLAYVGSRFVLEVLLHRAAVADLMKFLIFLIAVVVLLWSAAQARRTPARRRRRRRARRRPARCSRCWRARSAAFTCRATKRCRDAAACSAARRIAPRTSERIRIRDRVAKPHACAASAARRPCATARRRAMGDESWFGAFGPDHRRRARPWPTTRVAVHRVVAQRADRAYVASARCDRRRGRHSTAFERHLPRLHRRARRARRRPGRDARRRQRVRPAADADDRRPEPRLRGAGDQHVAAAALPPRRGAAHDGARCAVRNGSRRSAPTSSFFTGLHLAVAGSSFNYVALLVLPVLMAGVLTPRVLALATAALATLALLGTAWLRPALGRRRDRC